MDGSYRCCQCGSQYQLQQLQQSPFLHALINCNRERVWGRSGRNTQYCRRHCLEKCGRTGTKSRGVLLPISQANNNTTNTNHTTGVVLTNTAAGTGNNNNNNSSNSKHTEPPPRVLHPILLKVPLQIRFVTIGIILNIAFLGVYNVAITTFRSVAAPTTYSIVYLLFIPLGHWMNIMFVFGWPERYCSSLLSNLPVGLTGIGLGSGLTAYLDHVQFNDRIEEYIRDHFTFTRMPPRIPEDKSEFYSSLVVLFCTSLWTYFLSVYINTPRKQSDKKLL